MKNLIACLGILLGSLFLNTSGSGSTKRVEPLPSTIELPPPISSAEMEQLKHDAASGSGDAAKQIANSYLLFGYHQEEAYYWYMIGAENGDSFSMYSLWAFRKGHNGKWSSERGTYWLRKAAALGDEHAIEALKKIN